MHADIINNEAAIDAAVGTNTSVANQVNVFSFVVNVPTTILGGRWHCGTTATGSANMAIYTLAGAIVPTSDSGPINNVASNDVTFTYATPITLAPGIYFAAWASLNGTDTYLGKAATGTSVSRCRKAANPMAANAMPLTLGALTNFATYFAYGFNIQGALA